MATSRRFVEGGAQHGGPQPPSNHRCVPRRGPRRQQESAPRFSNRPHRGDVMTNANDKRVMPGTTVPPAPTTVYTVGVYCMTTWATGNMRGTCTRRFEVEEASTILGGCRAIDIAIERCNG